MLSFIAFIVRWIFNGLSVAGPNGKDDVGRRGRLPGRIRPTENVEAIRLPIIKIAKEIRNTVSDACTRF